MLAGQRSVNEARAADDLPARRADGARSGAGDPALAHAGAAGAAHLGARLRAEPGYRISLRTDDDGERNATKTVCSARSFARTSRPKKCSATNTSSRFTTSTRKRPRTCWSIPTQHAEHLSEFAAQGNAAAAARLLSAAAEIGTRFGPGRLPGGDERGPRRRPKRLPSPRPRPRRPLPAWPPG